MRSLLALLTLCAICVACTSTNSKKDVPVDTLSVATDIVAGPEVKPDESPVKDPFDELLEVAAPLLLSWNFEVRDTLTYKDSTDWKSHWWLKVLSGSPNRRLVSSQYWPTEADYKMIVRIRQHQFVRNWKYVLEEWTFTEPVGARRWFEIAENTQRVDDAKPPRYFWVRNDKLIFLMATAARDWFEHSDELLTTMRGQKPALLRLFEDPIDLRAYKLSKRGANSSSIIRRPYFLQLDTVGHYFNYFWFHSYRMDASISNSLDAVRLNTYIYGETIGRYEDVEEELISIKGMVRDPELDRLNVVGFSRQDIHDQFGLPMLKEQNLSVYVHKQDMLILHFDDDQVEWFNFLRTNLELTSMADLPPELKYYNERIPVKQQNKSL